AESRTMVRRFPDLPAPTPSSRSLAISRIATVCKPFTDSGAILTGQQGHRRSRHADHRTGARPLRAAPPGAPTPRGGPGRARPGAEPEVDSLVGPRLPGVPRRGAEDLQARHPAQGARRVGGVAG